MEDALQRLCEAIAAAERECGLDWRWSYSKLVPRETGSFELELSREEVLRALPRASRGILPGAGRGRARSSSSRRRSDGAAHASRARNGSAALGRRRASRT